MHYESTINSFITFLILIIAAFFTFIFIKSAVVIVPQERVGVVERLGKYYKSLFPGLHFLIPFFDRLVVIHDMREVPTVVPEQVCITKDNTQLAIDGVIYYQICDAKLATYGTSNFMAAIIQLSQTTLRSLIGKMELDKTLEERDEINKHVVSAVDNASINWGVKVLRYEIKNIQPPQHIINAMQEQITAEREKRAKIARSEGEKQEKINLAEGDRNSAIARSEGEKQSLINNALGQAQAILAIAEANAAAIRLIGEAINKDGGELAVNQKLAEQYINQFGNLAKTNNTLIIPSDLSNIAGFISTAMATIKQK